MRKFVKMAFLSSIAAFSSGAFADVPVKDGTSNKQLDQTRKHLLDTATTRGGTSKSTASVRCSWAVSPENALNQRTDVASKVAGVCSSKGVDPAFALSIAYQESRFNQNCKAPTTPHSGGERAEGVMQVLPATGKRMFRQAGLGTYNGQNEDHNIMAGCLYLAEGKKIANGSAYHVAGGYHSGYDSKVWRNNLKIPAGWPKTLNYAETVTKKWYPIFNRGLKGYSGGRFASDQFQADGLVSGINGISSITADQGSLSQRMQEQGKSIGQYDTERQEWVQNSHVRMLNAEATNSFVEALTLLAQFKMLAMSLQSTNESENAVLVNPIPVKPTITDPYVVDIVWNEVEQRWKVLNQDGSWSWLEGTQSDARIILDDPPNDGSRQAQIPTETTSANAAAIARVIQLLNN